MGAAMPAPRARPARPLRVRGDAGTRRRGAIDPKCRSPMVGRISTPAAADGPRVMPENPCASSMGVVARGGIEPPTRGFSVRRRARFRRTNPKTGNRFLTADRTAPPDRAYPEPEPSEPDRRSHGAIQINGLGASRPNHFRAGRGRTVRLRVGGAAGSAARRR